MILVVAPWTWHYEHLPSNLCKLGSTYYKCWHRNQLLSSEVSLFDMICYTSFVINRTICIV
jgi:hypothetical protein